MTTQTLQQQHNHFSLSSLLSVTDCLDCAAACQSDPLLFAASQGNQGQPPRGTDTLCTKCLLPWCLTAPRSTRYSCCNKRQQVLKDPAGFFKPLPGWLELSRVSVLAGTSTLISSPVTVNESVKDGGNKGHRQVSTSTTPFLRDRSLFERVNKYIYSTYCSLQM